MPNSVMQTEIEKYVTATSPSVKRRQRIEIEIAMAFLTNLFEDESNVFAVKIDNGEDESGYCENLADALDAMFKTDEGIIRVYKLAGQFGAKKAWKKFGWVYFVYGNDGWDVINDYTINLEPYMKGEVENLQEYYGG